MRTKKEVTDEISRVTKRLAEETKEAERVLKRLSAEIGAIEIAEVYGVEFTDEEIEAYQDELLEQSGNASGFHLDEK